MLAVAVTAAAAAAVISAAVAGAFAGSPATTAARLTLPRDRIDIPRAAAAPRRVLILTQTLGYHHRSIPAAVAALNRLFGRDLRFHLTFLPGAQALTANRLHGASAVVFLLTTGELPLSDAGKRALLSFVDGGGGLVGFHSATDTFHHWPAYIQLIGAEFVHHPPASTQTVIVEDRNNPATRLLPASFRIHEEFYEFRHDPRPHVHVLARLDTGPSGPDRPLLWCRRADRGRVFYDALGHFGETWRDPRQLDMVLGGIEWAAGLVPANC